MRTDAGKFSFAVDTGSSIQTRRAGAFVIICFTKGKVLFLFLYWVVARSPLFVELPKKKHFKA